MLSTIKNAVAELQTIQILLLTLRCCYTRSAYFKHSLVKSMMVEIITVATMTILELLILVCAGLSDSTITQEVMDEF